MKLMFLMALAASAGSAFAQISVEDHDYLVVQIPAKRLDQSPKVVVKKILAQIKNRNGQTTAYEIADERGQVIVPADHLNGQSIVSHDKIVDFVRTQPREKLVDFTWGTLQGDLDAMKRNDTILTQLIVAARNRSNFAHTDLAGRYGMALVSMSIVAHPKVAELLDEVANQTSVEVSGRAAVRAAVRESVDAEAAQ